MNDALRSRLINFKFGQAASHLENEPEEVCALVNALAAMFGNSGCYGGEMGIVVSAALKSIGAVEFSRVTI